MIDVAIVGGGVGGLTAAVALARAGIDAVVFEQAPGEARVGADLNLTPNAVRALDPLGIGDRLRDAAARPTHRISRTWDTGEETSRLRLSDEAERRYGAPQLTMHRADVIRALVSAVPEGCLLHGRSLVGLGEGDGGQELRFADGSTHRARVVIGADGIHSSVRTSLFGEQRADYTGVVAYRAVVPADRLPAVPNLDAFTKWWGPDPATQLVVFPLTRDNDVFVFATAAHEAWGEESWTCPGDMSELGEHYRGFHPEARAVLDACTSVLKSALLVRDPLDTWSRGTVTLLGDACHPMMPFMAQGAAMAIEDAVVLARVLGDAAAGLREVSEAFAAYEAERLPRTAAIQVRSRDNTWLKTSADGDWVYSYDAWSVALAPASPGG